MPESVFIKLNEIERNVDCDSLMGQLWKIWIESGKNATERYNALGRIARRWRYGSAGKSKQLDIDVSKIVDKLAKAHLPPKDSTRYLQYRSYYAWILELFLYENIHYSKFKHHEPNPSIFKFNMPTDAQLEDIVVDLNYDRPETNPEVFRLSSSAANTPLEEGESSFSEMYWSVANTHLDTVKKSLLVYEYVEKGSSEFHPDYLLGYSHAHHKVFELIEKKIADNNRLVYKRLFALPRISKWDSAIPNKNQLEQFIEKCTDASFAHLVRCLIGNHKLRFIGKRSPSGFFLVPVSREYHFVLVDKSIIISEYYRHDQYGDCVPDIMLAHSASGYHKVLERLYKDDFDNHIRQTRISSIQEITNAVDSLLGKLQQKLKATMLVEEDERYFELKNLSQSIQVKKEFLTQALESAPKE